MMNRCFVRVRRVGFDQCGRNCRQLGRMHNPVHQTLPMGEHHRNRQDRNQDGAVRANAIGWALEQSGASQL
jgi:hypothetical protein